jgi:uncharacterized protein YegP (UPF0339 family)
MSTKNKPGIHLLRGNLGLYYWHAVAPNGRITANGETYSRKSIALNGIRSTAVTLGASGKFKYYDHSKKDSPLKSYL